jgi:hypothetical protein
MKYVRFALSVFNYTHFFSVRQTNQVSNGKVLLSQFISALCLCPILSMFFPPRFAGAIANQIHSHGNLLPHFNFGVLSINGGLHPIFKPPQHSEFWILSVFSPLLVSSNFFSSYLRVAAHI